MALPNAGPVNCSSGLSARIFNNLRYDNPWKASQGGYVVGVIGCPLTLNGLGYSVSAVTTGVTGPAEPAWPLIIGNSVVDGGVTWTCDVLCNPSGNGVNYQGVLSAAALQALRVLAYDTARALADELGGGADYCGAIYNTAVAQALGAGVFTVINFGTREIDTDNAVTTGVAWKFTVPTGKDGTYHVSATASIPVTVSAVDCLITVVKNGAEIHRGTRSNWPVGTDVNQHVSSDLRCVAGDTLAVSVYVTSAQNIEAYGPSNRICIHRVFGS